MFFYECKLQGGNRTPAAWELHDLKNDPFEIQNHYANPEYAKTVAAL
ncbi:MAG: hypothetical protein ACFCD0_26635 [Gemmataceae bacterium]